MSTDPVKKISENKQFKQTKKIEYVSAIYYEPHTPIPFTTRISKLTSEVYEVDTKQKDSMTVHLLFGCIPLGLSKKYVYIREKKTVSNYFCEITPEMADWIQTMKPYLQENYRSRGKLQFRPTDDEINNKAEFQVYPVIIESIAFSGIAWKRYKPNEILLDV